MAKKKSLIVIMLFLLLFIPFSYSKSDRNGATICGKNFDCNLFEDFVCPGIYNDGSLKLPGADACKIDDYDCCIFYNKSVDVGNKVLFWDNSNNQNYCCGNSVGEFPLTEEAVDVSKVDASSSNACCTLETDCVDDAKCYPSLTEQKTCKDSASSCRDINDDGTVEVCLPPNNGKWKTIDNENECKNYMGKDCSYINGKCLCNAIVKIEVFQEKEKGKGNKNENLVKSADALVKIISLDPSNNYKKEKYGKYGGVTFDDVPIGVKMIVEASKGKYGISTLPMTFTGDSHFVMKLELINDCQTDCTKNDNICHKECIGVCKPDKSLFEYNNFKGKYLCDNAKASWSIQVPEKTGKNKNDENYKNEDKIIYCCLDKPIIKNAEQLAVKIGKAENLQTYSKIIILPDGTPGAMYITLWEDTK